jgi:hypothetical protein
MVRDGQTIVLGGLFRESTETSRRQVPFLGDIPLLGKAFRGHDDETQRNEIIFLITPTIVNDTTLAEAGERGMDAVERVRAGAREGVLRWSRDRMSALRNIEAERLAQEGDTDRALWMLDRSLTLNPGQADAITMRERLGAKRKNWPGRSILDDVIHGESTKKQTNSEVENGFGAHASIQDAASNTLSIETEDACPTALTFSPKPDAQSWWVREFMSSGPTFTVDASLFCNTGRITDASTTPVETE